MSKKNTIEDCHNLASKNGGRFLSEIYVDAHTHYIWECSNGHQWPAKYNAIQQGGWCKICRYKKRRLTTEECCDLAKDKGGKFLSKEHINTRTKHLWECEYGHIWTSDAYNIKRGHWCPTCKNNTVGEKIKDTVLSKYGVEYIAQLPEVALKAAKSSANTYILHHWKTGEELVCQASYEKATVEHWNENKINFLWQPKTFKMPNGKTYRPDCYLPDQDLWIEIKGYMRKDALEKWEWFKSEHPNSELWDKKKLKEKGILK